MKVETALHRLVNYTADMSFDPDVVHSMVNGVGEGIDKMVEGAGSGLGHLISGTVHRFGGFVSGILKGPFQMLLYIANVLIVIGLVILVASIEMEELKTKPKEDHTSTYALRYIDTTI